MAYIVERIRLGNRLIQALHIEQAIRDFHPDLNVKELRAFAESLDAHLGWFHIDLEDHYEVKDYGSYDRELTKAFRAHLRFVRGFAEREKRPWSRWTIRLIP